MAKPQRVEIEDVRATPEGTVYVGPQSRWSSPITWSDVGGQFPSLNDQQVGSIINREFENLVRNGRIAFPNWRHSGGERGPVEWTYPSITEIVSELAGKNLACFCEADVPCHADVLLRIANEAIER